MDFSKLTPEEQALAASLDENRIPRHIAIIMDGNGRWAVQQGLPRVLGHQAGVESVRAVVKACQIVGVEYLTLYSFSTENWARPDEEVNALMTLMERQLRLEAEMLHQEHVRVRHLGRRGGLPEPLCRALDDAEALTRENTALTLQLAINYSGRAEIVDAVRKLAAAAVAGEIDPAALDEADFAGALYTPDVPEPDLLVRTANERRISNYLLWQTAYAEFWVTPHLWPEFRGAHLLQAIADYQQRTRKFGKVPT